MARKKKDEQIVDDLNAVGFEVERVDDIALLFGEDAAPPVGEPYPAEEEAVAWGKANGFDVDEAPAGREVIVNFLRGVMNEPESISGDLIYSNLMTMNEALRATVAPLEHLNPGHLMVAINNAPADIRPYLNRLLNVYTAFGGWAEQLLAFEWLTEKYHDSVMDDEQSN